MIQAALYPVTSYRPPTASIRVSPLGQAERTLSRATRFLAGSFHAPAEGPYRARVLGNGLRELDRFLNLLVDQVALALAPPGFDHPAFARRRNTPGKLSVILARMARPSPHDIRLRAIGRSRDCLFHCAGIVRAGRAGMLTAAWPNAVPVAGRALIVLPADLASVCRFYDGLAADLLAALAAHGPRTLLFETNRSIADALTSPATEIRCLSGHPFPYTLPGSPDECSVDYPFP